MLHEKEVLTTGEVAKICNVAPRTVSKWFDSGQLKGYRIPGSKDRRIPVSQLVRFMKEHRIPLDGLTSGQVRVLIVDQDAEIRRTLSELLTQQTGYAVEDASGGFEAGLLCQRLKPHVLLLDLHVEGDDGRRIAEIIRASDDLQLTRIIAMSSRLTDGQIAQLRTQGFDQVLKKPFQLRQLVEAIEKATSIIH
ncbi:MAG: response regulator [Planctomycetota bacterium]|nr:MAG: response regulator [Planctomycetota bacterium]